MEVLPWPELKPEAGHAIRIQGDSPHATLHGENWKWGILNIEAPLPEGYPAPTPAECVEIKTYPVERRATVDSTKMWFRGLFGTSRAFFPLFFHIKKREIPMTSPVQMEYSDLNGKEDWKMSFLYRTKDLGPTGEASDTVTVIDGPEVTVLSIGLMGEYGTDVVKRGVE